MNDNLQRVYATLKNEGFDLPEYDVFANDMRDDNNLSEVRESLVRAGYTPPEFNVFKVDMFGEPVKEQEQPKSGNVVSPVIGEGLKQDVGVLDGAKRYDKVSNQPVTVRPSVAAKMSPEQIEEAEKQVENEAEPITPVESPKGEPEEQKTVEVKPQTTLVRKNVTFPKREDFSDILDYAEAYTQAIREQEAHDEYYDEMVKLQDDNTPQAEMRKKIAEARRNFKVLPVGEQVAFLEKVTEKSYDELKKDFFDSHDAEARTPDTLFRWLTGGNSYQMENSDSEQLTKLTNKADARRSEYGGFSQNEILSGLAPEEVVEKYQVAEYKKATDDFFEDVKGKVDVLINNLRADYDEEFGVVEDFFMRIVPKVVNFRNEKEDFAIGADAQDIRAAKYVIDATDKMRKAAIHDKNGWDAFWERLPKAVNFAGDGSGDAALAIYRLSEKIEKGEELTLSEQILEDALISQMMVADAYAKQVDGSYALGENLADMGAFMIETAFSPGKGTAKSLAKQLVKKFKNKYARRLAAGGGRFIGAAIEGGIAAVTTASPRVAEGALEKMAGKPILEHDENGEPRIAGFKDQEGAWEAAGEAFLENTVEFGTEALGAEWITKALSKPAKVILGKTKRGQNLMKGINRMMKDNKYVRGLKNAINYDGVAEEFLEEFEAAILNPTQSVEEFLEPDNLVNTLIMVAIPGTVFSTANTIAGAATGAYKTGAAEKWKMQQAAYRATMPHGAYRNYLQGSNETAAWTPADWAKEQEIFDNGTVEDVEKELKRIYSDSSLTPEQKLRATEYAIYSLQYRAAKGVKNAMSDERKAMLDDMLGGRYEEGYNTDPATVNGNTIALANKALDDARVGVRAALNLGEDADVDAIIAGKEFEGEAKAAVDTYLAEKAKFEGMRDRFNEQRENEIAEAEKEVDAVMHEDGNVYITTLPSTGEAIFITGGKVVLDSEGYIDVNQSEGLVALMPNGKKEAIQPGNIREKVAVENADAQKAAKRAEIDNRYKSQLNTFVYSDSEGDHTVMLVGRRGDMVDALIDGKPTEVPAKEFEAIMADATGKQPVEVNAVKGEKVVTGDNVPAQATAVEQPVANEVPVSAPVEQLPKEKQTPAPIPTEKRGKTERAAYHLVPIERAMEDLHDGALEADEIESLIDARIKEAENEVKAAENKKPVIGADKDAYVAAKKQWQEAMDAAKAKLDYYNNLKAVNAEVTRSEMREAVEGVAPQTLIEQTADEFVANQLGGWIKITPESFQKETGLKAEQKQMVGVIAGKDKGGMTIEQAAETILENYGDELRGLGFNGDMQDMRDMIINILSNGNPRSYAKKGAEMRAQESVEQQRSELESVAHGLNFNSIEEQIEYEEAVVPRIIQDYTGFDEQEYFNNLAENYEYDTTREGEGTRGGSELLQGEQAADNAGVGDITESGQGGEIQGDVYSGGENAAPQGNQQVNGSEIPNGSTGEVVPPVESTPVAEQTAVEETPQAINEMQPVQEVVVPTAEEVADAQAFAEAFAQDTVEAYQNYLDNHPEGAYRDGARAGMWMIEGVNPETHGLVVDARNAANEVLSRVEGAVEGGNAPGQSGVSASLVKGTKWENTGEPDKIKSSRKKGDSHDITWYIGKKKYGSTTAERDLLVILAEDYGGDLNAVWNAYEQGEVYLGANEAAILKKLIETNTSAAELQQGALELDRENPAFERATENVRKKLEATGVKVVQATKKMVDALMKGSAEGLTADELHELRGIVARGLADAEVKIINCGKNPFNTKQKTVALKKEVLNYAEKNGIIGTMSNEETNGKGEVRISKKSIGKFVDDSASDKSVDKDVHLSVLPQIRDVIASSVEAEVHPDYIKIGDDRSRENGYNKNVMIHRCYGAVNVDGKVYRVKITLKEDIANRDTKAYSYEVTNIELLEGTDENAVTVLSQQDSSITGAKLLDKVEKSYDKGTKLLSASKNVPDFMKTFHGSGEKFDKFDHSFMGTGEGVQAFGWGTYVTEVEGIGRAYATTMRDKLISEKHKENAIINKLAKQTLESSNGNKEEALDYLRGLLNESWSDKKRVKAQIKIIETGKFLPETKQKANLYTVEIPDDNGSNYLHWDKRIPMNVVNSIKKRLFDVLAEGDYKGAEKELKRELDDVFKADNNDGNLIYGNISAYLGGDKAASQFLNDMGFVGISYPAEAMTGGRKDGARNYVIFNENDAQIESRIEFLRTPDGVTYGWAVNGTIYLTPEGLNPNTPIHEYTHLWAAALQKSNPKLWGEVVEAMKLSPAWNEVMADENYTDIHGDDNRVASEVLSRLSGNEGYRRYMEQAEAEIAAERNIGEKVRKKGALNFFKRIWNKFRNWLQSVFKSGKVKAGDGTEAKAEPWDVFVNKSLKDFDEGVNPDAKDSPLEKMAAGENSAEMQASKKELTPEQKKKKEALKENAKAIRRLHNVTSRYPITALRNLGFALETQEQREMHDRLFAERDAITGESKPAGLQTNPQAMTLQERITESLLKHAEQEKENVEMRLSAIRAYGRDLANVIKLMNAQKGYDRNTVRSFTDLVKMYMRNNAMDGMSSYEVMRLLNLMQKATGGHAKTVNGAAVKIAEIITEAHTKQLEAIMEKQIKTGKERVNASGVVVQGGVDIIGKRVLNTYRDAIKVATEEDFKKRYDAAFARVGDLQKSIENAKNAGKETKALENLLKEAQADADAMLLAANYRNEIKVVEEDIEALKSKLSGKRDALAKGEITRGEYYESAKTINSQIVQLRAQQIDAYQKVLHALSGDIYEGVQRARAFREAEAMRVQRIHDMAENDMGGVTKSAERKEPGVAGKTVDMMVYKNPLTRAVMHGLGTYENYMKYFGRDHLDGRGELFEYFMTAFNQAQDKEWKESQNDFNILEAAAQKIFGNKGIVKIGKKKIGKTYKTIARDSTKPSGVILKYWNGGATVERELTIGQLMYLYMAEKQAEGQMKLRNMGLTEEKVQNAVAKLPAKYKAFADYIQAEFLPEMRPRMNEVHQRMFGASMSEVENYFPLKVNQDARKGDTDLNNTGDAIPSTITGAVIKRRVNVTPIDLTANAFDVLNEHIVDMEHWAAFAEFTRDNNTLINDNDFKNRVKNTKSIRHGDGEKIWKDFVETARITTGNYQQRRDYIAKLMSGANAAKITFGYYTALKQLSSLPAFLADANAIDLVWNTAKAYGSWQWAIKNLPGFEERWKGRTGGNERLGENEYSIHDSRIMKAARMAGMTPNAFIDAAVVAAGARAVYETRLRFYKKLGMTEYEADRRAKNDAAISYNETQQSGQGAYLSRLQKEGGIAALLTTLFRNSQMAFQRRVVGSLVNTGKKLARSERIREATKRKYMQMGMDEAAAEKRATKEFYKSYAKDITNLAIFGYGMNYLWVLMGQLPYLLFGDDDEEKEKIFDMAKKVGITGMFEGFTLGNVAKAYYENKVNGTDYAVSLLEAPFEQDLDMVLSRFEKDGTMAGILQLGIFLTEMNTGISPQRLIDDVAAVIDLCDGDVELANDGTLFALRMLKAPQSQQDMLILDELEGADAERVKKVAEKFIEYKMTRNFPFGSEDEKRVDKYANKFVETLKERVEKDYDPEDISVIYDRSSDTEKEILKKKWVEEMDKRNGTNAAKSLRKEKIEELLGSPVEKAAAKALHRFTKTNPYEKMETFDDLERWYEYDVLLDVFKKDYQRIRDEEEMTPEERAKAVEHYGVYADKDFKEVINAIKAHKKLIKENNDPEWRMGEIRRLTDIATEIMKRYE